jgi:hypothetical protein
VSPRVRAFVLIAAGSLLLTVTAVSSLTPAAAGASGDPVIAAVGDIACQSYSQSDGEGVCRSDEVAALVNGIAPDRFLALGDLQYSNGKLAEFLRVYDLQFGHLKPITMPTPGNHEYGTEGAQGYFDYFGAEAHGPDGVYSFDLGASR